MRTVRYKHMHKNKQSAFTIVELLIVIVVIGVLSAIVLNSFAGARDRAVGASRTQKVVVLSKALELYYAENGYYPEYSQMRDETWVKNNLTGVKASDFRDEYGNFISQNPGSTVIEYYSAEIKPTGTPPGPDDCGAPPKPYRCRYFKVDSGYMLNGQWIWYGRESLQ
jgi:prepilin-type N-terminal cleavage/methylation domain-containing protein